jgi:hypothetical protein
LMSSAEAHDINSRLPPKFKYIPVDQLATEPPTEAPKAAPKAGAPGAAVTPVVGPSPSPSEGGDGGRIRLRSRDGSKN